MKRIRLLQKTALRRRGEEGGPLRTASYGSEYFDPAATLGCGQVFRYFPAGEEGSLVLSAGRACLLRREGGCTFLSAEEDDFSYFERYFDLSRNYADICARVCALGIPRLCEAAAFGRGIRILNQDPAETIFSFIVSQNNNIPRIRAILARLCEALGEARTACGHGYFSFPRLEALAGQGEAFYASLGCGYRARYLAQTARLLAAEGTERLSALPTPRLREALLRLPGVGPKVADCILLFAFHRTEAFPVDTWVEKAYRSLGGTLRGREKIAAALAEKFGDLGGYVQQYLFYFEREGGTERWHPSR